MTAKYKTLNAIRKLVQIFNCKEINFTTTVTQFKQ